MNVGRSYTYDGKEGVMREDGNGMFLEMESGEKVRWDAEKKKQPWLLSSTQSLAVGDEYYLADFICNRHLF